MKNYPNSGSRVRNNKTELVHVVAIVETNREHGHLRCGRAVCTSGCMYSPCSAHSEETSDVATCLDCA